MQLLEKVRKRRRTLEVEKTEWRRGGRVGEEEEEGILGAQECLQSKLPCWPMKICDVGAKALSQHNDDGRWCYEFNLHFPTKGGRKGTLTT